MIFKRQWGVFILGALVAYLTLEVARAKFIINTEELAFGTETTHVLGDVDGLVMHCLGARDSALCEKAFDGADASRTVLWVGNSQLPAINLFEAGQENAPQLLFRRLRARDIYLTTYSQPNANLSEHAVLINSLLPRYKPDLVVLPVVFDDIREQGVRPLIADFMQDADSLNAVRDSKIWGIVKPSLETQSADASSKANASDVKKESLQKVTERAFTGWLERHWPLWRDRTALRGTLASAKHLLRNRMLGIHSYTKRSVHPVLYRDRMALLDFLIDDIQASGAQALLYLPPYRDDIDGPYIEAQYEAFKADLEALARSHNTAFADFEGLVPGKEWATVTDRIFGFKEPDFMHFTQAGHTALASGLNERLIDMGF